MSSLPMMKNPTTMNMMVTTINIMARVVIMSILWDMFSRANLHTDLYTVMFASTRTKSLVENSCRKLLFHIKPE